MAIIELIINITLSSNVIGLEDHVFTTNWLPRLINQSHLKLHFK